MTEKKNPDYTASAINLCNPDEVRLALIDLHEAQQKQQDYQEKADELLPSALKLSIETWRDRAIELTSALKDAILEHGSYQDTELGRYALQQAKKSAVYHVDPFKEHFEKHIGSVVEEKVNAKALQGLVKGGLIEQADLEMHKVVTYDETRAFIIK